MLHRCEKIKLRRIYRFPGWLPQRSFIYADATPFSEVGIKVNFESCEAKF